MEITLSIPALDKLLEVTASGLGSVARPWIVKRDAKAIVEMKRILEDGGLSLDKISAPGMPSEISSRLTYQEAKRQRNLRNVVEKTLEFLPEKASGEAVDEDWISRFFNHAQDVSSEKMQEVWAKLLAGEVVKPGSCSLRTLDALKNMNSEEARLFANICQFEFNGILINPFGFELELVMPELPTLKNDKSLKEYEPSGKDYSIMVKKYGISDYFEKIGINSKTIIHLVEIGLLFEKFDDGVAWSSIKQEKFYTYFVLGKRVLEIHGDNSSDSIGVSVLRFTSIGRELFQLIERAEQPEFETLLAEAVEKLPFKAKWINVENANKY
jgi:hypothetical protein